jgi:predicted nucleotidyltransferase
LFDQLGGVGGDCHPGILARCARAASGRLVVTMAVALQDALEILRTHETDLRQLGVAHAAVFGSVARGETRADSDVDVLIELDDAQPIGVFEYARLKLYIGQLFNGASDVVNRRTLKPLLRGNILLDAIDAF